MRASRTDITSINASLRVIHPRSYPYSSPSMDRPRTQVTPTQPTVQGCSINHQKGCSINHQKRLLNQPSKRLLNQPSKKVAQSTVKKGCSINRQKRLLNQPPSSSLSQLFKIAQLLKKLLNQLPQRLLNQSLLITLNNKQSYHTRNTTLLILAQLHWRLALKPFTAYHHLRNQASALNWVDR